MKLACRLAVLSMTSVVMVTAAGCGGGGASTPPLPITVSVSAPAATVDAGSQVGITAQVGNDSSNRGLTWTMSPAPGTGSGVLTNATAASVTYKAPGRPPANNVTVTITGTSVADSSKSGSVTITLNAISVSTSSNNYSVGAGGTSLISAAVSGDPSNQGVTWTMSPASGAGT